MHFLIICVAPLICPLQEGSTCVLISLLLKERIWNHSLTDFFLVYNVSFFKKEKENQTLDVCCAKIKTSSTWFPFKLNALGAHFISVSFLGLKVLLFWFQSAQSKFPLDQPNFIKELFPLKTPIKRLARTFGTRCLIASKAAPFHTPRTHWGA